MIFVFDVDGASVQVERLLQTHASDLERLQQPLEALLSEAELGAISRNGNLSAAVAAAWEVNADTMRALLLQRPPPVAQALPAPPGSASIDAPPAPLLADAVYAGADQLLGHLARDWSEAGRHSRRLTHRPVLQELRRLSSRKRLRVLVPGAGACRLAWEIALQGHRVEANDASAPMMIAARNIITKLALSERTERSSRLRVYPWLRCEVGAVRRADCMRGTLIPDARSHSAWTSAAASAAAASAAAARISFSAADFFSWATAEAATCAEPWDAIVTCYVIDALPSPASAIRLMLSLLPPGGYWINLGPLVWHDPTLGLLRLALDELLALAAVNGFDELSSRVIRRVPYLDRREQPFLAAADEYDVALFVLQKRAVPLHVMEHPEPEEHSSRRNLSHS